MAELKAINGPTGGTRYPLDDSGDTWVIGRHPKCDIVVDESSISRQHARVLREENEFFVEDLGSRNHTYVNGNLISTRVRLADGDEIKLCDTIFQFREKPLESNGDSFFSDDIGSTHQSTVLSKVSLSSLTDSSRLVASPAVTLDALLEISRALGRAISLDDVLPQVLNGLFRIFLQADRGYIALLDADGNLVPRWSQARREDMSDFRVSRTIANEVLTRKEAILSVDALSDDRFDTSQSIADFRIRSMMCAPLLDSNDDPMGILQLDTTQQHKQFRESDLEVLVAVATQASIAIDNARLHEQTLRQKAVERDLELAHEVQQSFLPTEAPQVAGYEFHHFYRPAHHIGGDYFDYVTLPDGRIAVVVADVVGHGVAAALLMAKLSAETRYCLAAAPTPAEAVTALNERMSHLPIDRFVTLILIVLDPQTHEVTVVNAGHMAPLWLNRDGDVVDAGDESGFPVGIFDDHEYEQETITLGSGEMMLLYTDGVNESCDADETQFGIDRIRETLLRTGGEPQATIEQLVNEVGQFAVEQEDDMCLVGLRRLP